MQAIRHAFADVRDEFEVCGLPLDSDPVLQLFHRLSVMSIHTPLEIIPQVLYRAAIRTPCRPIDEMVKPDLTCVGSVRGGIVLLIPPLSSRPEWMDGLNSPS